MDAEFALVGEFQQLLAPIAEQIDGHETVGRNRPLRRAPVLLNRPADDQLLLQIRIPVDRRLAEAPVGRSLQWQARCGLQPGTDDLLLPIDRSLVDTKALQSRRRRVEVSAEAAVDMAGGSLQFPQSLARGRVDQDHAAGRVAEFDVVVHFQPGASRIDVADEQAVGMALAGAPQRNARVVQDHRTQRHFVAAVAVHVHALGEVGSLSPVLGRRVGVAEFPKRPKLVADQFVSLDLHQPVRAPQDNQAGRAAVQIGHGQLITRYEVVAVEPGPSLARRRG